MSALKTTAPPLPQLIIGALLIGLLFAWEVKIIPELTKIKPDFSYQAEVIALDNFYNENNKVFEGERRSVASLEYEVVKKQENELLIQNTFNVRDITGKKIVTINRIYGIDALTRAHITNSGDQRRNGFLFAPRNLKRGQPFTYWHVNYDQPAHMKFVDEENFFGLKVYHYETRFENQKIDQTKNLTFLPGVPQDREVILEPHLEIWVEPVTGRLIKYTDDTIAWYYDKKTGSKLHPWNHFRNSLGRMTVLQQTRAAQHEKKVFLIIEHIIPLILCLLIITLFTIFVPFLYKVILLITLITASSYSIYLKIVPNVNEKKVIIGISTWNTTSEYNQTIQGFKNVLTSKKYREGETIEYFIDSAELDEHKQADAINTLKEKKPDLIFSLTGQGTLAIKKEIPDRPIVFSFVAFPVELGLISSLQRSGNNLVGTRNWVSAEDQLSLVKKVLPTARKIGYVHREGSFYYKDFKAADAARFFTLIDIPAKDISDLIKKIGEKIDGVDALYGSCDLLMQNGGDQVLVDIAKRKNKPAFSCFESGVQNGALAGIVPDYYELGRLSGEKAASILEGMSPAALETSVIDDPFLYFNQNTATDLGIEIPQNLLVHAHRIFP